MRTLFAFDNDGVLRDESSSYQRCIVETVTFLDKGIPASNEELVESMKQSNNDWERAHKILKQRGISVDFETVKEHFKDLYLGKERNFTGYINDEPWLADNNLLAKLAKSHPLMIVSGSPKNEVEYTLKRNGASGYFSLILGMYDCDGKKDGLEKAIAHFNPDEIFFCDDRPSPIGQVKGIKHCKIYVFGIIPPQANKGWHQVLKDAGAKEVFPNVKKYCQYLIDYISKS